METRIKHIQEEVKYADITVKFDVTLNPTISVLYGCNGVGKTLLMNHIQSTYQAYKAHMGCDMLIKDNYDVYNELILKTLFQSKDLDYYDHTKAPISNSQKRYIDLIIECYTVKNAILLFENPTSDLHFDLVTNVAKALKYASKSNQVIVTTHSIMLLNKFEFEDIIAIERKDNLTYSVKPNVHEDLVDERPGRLWVKGLIGGKKW